MKVLKVIVDEMPEGNTCFRCKFWQRFGRNDRCVIRGLPLNQSNLEDTRPSWCPLEVETDEPKEVKGE